MDFIALSSERPRNNDRPNSNDKLNSTLDVSIAFLTKNKQTNKKHLGFFREMSNSRYGEENVQNELEHIVILESKEVTESLSYVTMNY